MSQAAAAELPPRHYEAIYILRPDVSKEAAEKVASRVQEVVARGNGKLTLVESWGRRPLAYAIAHKKRGVYVYVSYLGDGALVAELERNFRMLDEVVRFQTVKLSDEAEIPAAGEVQFEAYEPPAEGEEDELTIEQELGLVQSPRTMVVDDDDDMDDMGGSDDEEDD